MNDEDDKKDEQQDEAQTSEDTQEAPQEQTEETKEAEVDKVPEPGDVVEPTPKKEEQSVSGYEKLNPAQQSQVDELSDEELDKIVSQLKTDEDGTVDLKSVLRVLNQRNQETTQRAVRNEVLNTLTEVDQSRQAWKEAEETYPQLAENQNLRKLVENQRIASIAEGGNQSPKEAADTIFAEFKEVKAEATRQSQESVRIQQAGSLQTASNQTGDSVDEDRLFAQSGDPDRAKGSKARQSLLKKWIDDGKIQLAP